MDKMSSNNVKTPISGMRKPQRSRMALRSEKKESVGTQSLETADVKGRIFEEDNVLAVVRNGANSGSNWRKSLNTFLVSGARTIGNENGDSSPRCSLSPTPIAQDGNVVQATPYVRNRGVLQSAAKSVSFTPASVRHKLRPRVYKSPSKDVYVRHEDVTVVIDPSYEASDDSIVYRYQPESNEQSIVDQSAVQSVASNSPQSLLLSRTPAGKYIPVDGKYNSSSILNAFDEEDDGEFISQQPGNQTQMLQFDTSSSSNAESVSRMTRSRKRLLEEQQQQHAIAVPTQDEEYTIHRQNQDTYITTRKRAKVNHDDKAAATPIPCQNQLQPKHQEFLQSIYGPCIANMRYKGYFTPMASNLIRHTRIWAYQRPVDLQRVKIIADTIAKTGVHLGVISVYCLQKGREQELGVFDGQHRMHAIQRLIDMVGDFPVSIELHPVESQSHISMLYRAVNQCEPVQDVDLHQPELLYGDTKQQELIDATSLHKQVIQTTVERLLSQHKTMFRPSTRCLPPHINADTLRNQLYASQLCSYLKISTVDQLLSVLLHVNKVLGTKPASYWPLKSRNAALAKAKQYGFYLGQDYVWLDDLMQQISNNTFTLRDCT